ncbi:hypothetical protein ONZ45_g14229 [Pleurotus djamor]|nr:hypothetical protein ONZ45_g14229 [Pleurotus djamor]
MYLYPSFIMSYPWYTGTRLVCPVKEQRRGFGLGGDELSIYYRVPAASLKLGLPPSSMLATHITAFTAGLKLELERSMLKICDSPAMLEHIRPAPFEAYGFAALHRLLRPRLRCDLRSEDFASSIELTMGRGEEVEMTSSRKRTRTRKAILGRERTNADRRERPAVSETNTKTAHFGHDTAGALPFHTNPVIGTTATAGIDTHCAH